MTLYRALDADTGETLLERVRLADSFWSRLIGLLAGRSIAPDEGLLLSPCNSVHTCGMRFSIDVAQLDHDHLVLAVRTDVRPWSVVAPVRGGRHVLEGAPGTLEPLRGRRLLFSPRNEGDSSGAAPGN